VNGQMRQQAAVSASPYVGDSRVEYYEPPSRLQLLDKLHHLVRFSDFLLVVQGAPGSGKTSLLRQLKIQSADGRLCYLSLQQGAGTATLLRQLGEGCGLDIADCTTQAQLLERIHVEARQAQEVGLQWLVLVDDADLLDDDALELLVNLQNAGLASIRTVLAGRSIAQRLVAMGLSQELEGRMHQEFLQPFDVAEAGDFIRLRYPALEVLDSRKLQQLVSDSDRMPGSLDRLASQALRLKSPAPVVRRDRSALVFGAASLMLVVIVAMAGWIYWQPGSAVAVDSERVSVPLAVPVIAASVERAVPQIDIVEAPQPLALLPQADPGDVESPVALVDSPATVSVPSVLSAQDFLPDASRELPVNAEPDAGVTEVVVEPALVALQPDARVVEVPVEPEPAPTLEQRSAVSVAPITTADHQSPVIGSDAPPAAAVPAVQDEGGLLSWPDRGYTLQLLGARQLETAKGFIADQQDPEAFYYFSTLYKGKPWHVVVTGRYDSRKEASAAVQKLPSSLQKLKPWARSIQGVKADIRKVSG